VICDEEQDGKKCETGEVQAEVRTNESNKSFSLCIIYGGAKKNESLESALSFIDLPAMTDLIAFCTLLSSFLFFFRSTIVL
jgi:hypothetical protein